MSKTSLYLPAPAFGLTWHEAGDADAQRAFVLMPGGGGSSKTGVKNQIMLASFDTLVAQKDQVKLLDGFLTDTPERSLFCSGVSCGTMFGKPVVCTLMENRCAIYAVTMSADKPEFQLKLEVQAPKDGEECDLNCCLVTESGLLAAGGDGKVVHLWDVTADEDGSDWEGESLFDLKGHQKAITALAEHRFSSWVCSASKDGTCKIWDTLKGQLLLDIPALVDGLGLNPKTVLECKGCCFSQDGASLYSIQCNKRGPTHLIVWDISTKVLQEGDDDKKAVVRLMAHASKSVFVSKFAASKLVISGDGQHLGVGVADGHVIVLRTEGYRQIADVACHDFPVTGLGFAPAHVAETLGLEAVVATCSADRNFNMVRISKTSLALRLLQLLFVILMLIVVSLLYTAGLNILTNINCPTSIERAERFAQESSEL